MSVLLMAEVDGRVVPLNICNWVLWAPCGCPYGLTVASYAPTEEEAWRGHYPRKRDRERKQRQGHRMELMTHDRYSAEVYPLMLQRCTHYGQQELPGVAS